MSTTIRKYSRWEDVAFEQEKLLRAATEGYFGQLCDGYQATAGIPGPQGLLRKVMTRTFELAEPIYVAPKAMDLWEKAAESFRPEPIHRTDLVCPAGFALLPRPYELTDVHDQTVKIRAFCWLPISSRTTYNWDEGEPGQGVAVGLLSSVHDTDQVWEQEQRDWAIRDGYEWSLMHWTPMLFDQDGWQTQLPDNYTEEERHSVRRMWATIQSFWRIMGQLVPTSERLPRQWARQRKRKALIETVTVIQLRRPRGDLPEGARDPEGDVDWSHRWVVRGHWRNQWYATLGPKDDPRARRQIWISPFVKGPEDKPIVVTKRVWEWTR